MKRELKNHLIPLGVIFLSISIFWFLNHVPWYYFLYLFLGFLLGSFFLDIDHIIYWLYLRPDLEESKLASEFIKQKKYKQIIRLLEKNHKTHTSLIFHHYFFQVILALISVFVFTSSISIFTKGFVLALNIHLIVDEIIDYRSNPRHLLEWLFAREEKQVPLKSIHYYVFTFLTFCLVFTLLLASSF